MAVPLEPFPLEEAVEEDAVEVVGERGHAQVVMDQSRAHTHVIRNHRVLISTNK